MENRILKFKRVFENFTTKAIEFREWGPEWKDGQNYSFTSPSYLHGFKAVCDVQFTGLLDKNGKEIYEGDIVRIRTPYRETQTHTGDNIPNGSYTEPMEAEIREEEVIVEFLDGAFRVKIDNYYTDTPALSELIYNYDLESLKDAVHYSERHGLLFDDPEEGDLTYLLTQYNQPSTDELLKFISGVEIIGNLYENPELLSTNQAINAK